MDHTSIDKPIELRNAPDLDRSAWFKLLPFLPILILAPLSLLPSAGLRVTESPPLLQFAPYLMAVFILIAIAMVVSMRSPRLRIDDVGLHFQSAFPGWLMRLAPSWSYRWEEIDVIGWPQAKGFSPRHHVIEVRAGTEVRRLPLMGKWREVETSVLEDLPKRPWWRLSSQAQANKERVEQHALIRALQIHGIPLEPIGPSPDSIFREPTAAAITVAILLLLLFAVFEGMAAREAYFTMPWTVLVLVAVSGAVIARGVLRSPVLKEHERALLPLVFAVALGFAASPGLLRINALGGELQAHTYINAGDGTLYAADGVAPSWLSDRFASYWQEFPEGTEHTLLVRQGALGFWSFDQLELRREIYAYECAKLED